MNYNINNTISSIEEEIRIAKKYNKKVNTIYEIKFDNQNSFPNFEDIEQDYNKLLNKYNYSISIAFHHYDSAKIFEKKSITILTTLNNL